MTRARLLFIAIVVWELSQVVVGVGIALYLVTRAHASDSTEHDRGCAEWVAISTPWPTQECFLYSQTGSVVCSDVRTKWECK